MGSLFAGIDVGTGGVRSAPSMPAVFLFFVGWSYLYFYFASFGINISEINLDTSTVLIYSCNVVSEKDQI